MHLSRRSKVGLGLLLTAFAVLVGALLIGGVARPSKTYASGGSSFIGGFHHVSTIASTVPGNGDVNPYGTVVVQHSVGKLTQGDVLVSNFNNKANLQGTGTTIVEISPNGTRTLFAHLQASNLHGACPGGVGLTTALVVLERGWVIVGSLPTSNGMSATAKAGCLIVLNSNGTAVETFSGKPINGPWDMTAYDKGSQADLFVTNVLNGTVAANGKVVKTATVVRIELNVPNQGNGVPKIQSTTIIGSGFSARTDPAALVLGPTGVGLSSNGTLYVADTVNSRIAAISNALTRTTSASTGRTVTTGGALNAPLGLTIAPNGDILTVNGNNGFMVETTPGGTQVAKKLVDKTVAPGSPPGAGCLFGLAVRDSNGVYFVDDCTNTLNLLH
jgi:NHL repeat-containing protein